MKKNSPEYFDYLNVPVALCTYSLQQRRANQVRLFLYLKSISKGYVKHNSELYINATKDLDVCDRTIRNHLNWLIQEGWLIPDRDAKSIRIVSFEILVRKLNLLPATGVLIYKSDLKNYKTIAIAAIVKYNLMRPKRRIPETEFKKWSSQSPDLPPYPHLPNSVLSRIVGISRTTASRYKNKSKRSGYIETKKVFADTGIPIAEISQLRQYGGYQPGKVRNIKNRVVIQLADKIMCNIKLRRKRNLKPVCRKIRLEKNGHVKCGYI
jgi:hypothetical protein